MAMTRQQWDDLQRNLPAEDQTSYEQYLASLAPTTPTKSTPTVPKGAAPEEPASTPKTSNPPAANTATDDEYVTHWRSGIKAKKGTALYDTIVKQNADRADRDAAFEDKPTEDPGKGYRWVWQERNRTWEKVFFGTPSGGGGGTGGGSTGGGGGGNTGGLTQADIDKAVADAVAKANAASNAAIAQMKAEQEAAKLSAKQKASDKLSAMFAAYGLESLAPFISSRIMADVSEEMLLLELYDRPEYQQRFPGMKNLRAKKRTITEGEYMKIEKEMTQTARFFDLPVGFYDNPEDFGKLIANEVSAKEYQDRLQVGQDLARSLNPVVKQQLLGFYGVGEGGLTAYVLDPDKALSLIKKQAQAARFVGFGRGAGFQLQGITAGQAENIAGTEAYAKLSEQQLAQALGQAGQLRTTQSRLAKIEGQAYSEEEALKAVIEGSPEALLASQQRAQREAARFGGRSGLTGQSLGSATAI